MTARSPVFVFLIALAEPGLAGGDLAPEVLVLSRIKQTAREGFSQIPAYVCSETVSRFTRRSSLQRFMKIDGFEVQVAEIGARELFARPGDKEFQDKPLTEMVRPGMVATGLFFVMANSVFLSPATIFHYHGQERRGGRRAVRYDYRIAQIFSNYEIQSGSYHAIAGMSGSFWADAKTLQILEVQVHAVDIPPQLRMRSAVTTITYSSAKLAPDRTYLIPAGAVITIVSDTGSEDQNRTDFRNCRKYIGEATITFD